LVGEPRLYYLLTHFDPEFCELFKVAADFDNRMDRDRDGVRDYARLLASIVGKQGLRPFDVGSVARVIEHGARLAGDAEKLTAHMASISDLAREANYWAGEDGTDTVTADHVNKAVDAREYRSDRIRARVQEEIQRGTLHIETDGAATGQVNALSVIQLDHFAFGRPMRVSCRVRMGKGEVVDIEREVALGGPLHSKGVMILSSYLSTTFVRDIPLTLSASLAFEQSYGGVEGDSASMAELAALMSALAEIPIRQSLAITGSVDQMGRAQAVGGVNEKIEGFFDACDRRGLTGEQGVIIPASNVKHLMLRADVVEAARAGKFNVFAVENIDQAMGLLTGEQAGEADEKGAYPLGSVNSAVARRLEKLAKQALTYATQATTSRRSRVDGRRREDVPGRRG
ncbi:MAG: Lon protease family protein, partial [Alphaproteobacteria bacterium]